MKYLFIDYSNLVYRNLFTISPAEIADEDYGLLKYQIVRSLAGLINKFPGRSIVIAMDGRNPWRRDIYPDYKGNRAAQRAKSAYDFEKINSVIAEFSTQLKQIFWNCRFLKIDRVEADDIIAVLTKELYEKCEEIVNISSDRDFYQLLQYDNYKQWDPLKNTEIQVIDPKRYLLEKVMVGDKSDNIPHIKAKLGPKTAAKVLDSNVLDEWLEKENLRERFDLNWRLISFDAIPADVTCSVRNAFDGYEFKTRNSMKAAIEAGLGNIISDLCCLNLIKN